jgi:hypothetical protein
MRHWEIQNFLEEHKNILLIVALSKKLYRLENTLFHLSECGLVRLNYLKSEVYRAKKDGLLKEEHPGDMSEITLTFNGKRVLTYYDGPTPLWTPPYRGN